MGGYHAIQPIHPHPVLVREDIPRDVGVEALQAGLPHHRGVVEVIQRRAEPRRDRLVRGEGELHAAKPAMRERAAGAEQHHLHQRHLKPEVGQRQTIAPGTTTITKHPGQLRRLG
ncbi:unnamed protein product [Phytomonas sp. Hart1]|nr:unnamed protein product [Phytomonas sp. Hart1]|eukprot:CCW71684.1 unnamed protein product [Phytomonas sp. isolate Hart1]